ncbi:hypothetical protein [uncultured Bradyrhizobium sp.]|uniref:phage adaptor protein n=1 Tax=uncultured Bradyrhizobium sp. TaxID=199684 RepID=UPI0035CBFE58
MAIANYTDLQSAIADWLARADLTARIPDFVALAEGHFNRELRTREMLSAYAPVLSGGTASLPPDFLESYEITWTGPARSRSLKNVEPDSEAWRFRYRPNGDPSMFVILASTVSIRPAAGGNITIVYYQSIPPLVSNSTNWLLTKCPDLYLYRALAEAYIYQKNDEKSSEFIALATAEVGKAIAAADSNKLARRPNSPPPGDDTGTA